MALPTNTHHWALHLIPALWSPYLLPSCKHQPCATHHDLYRPYAGALPAPASSHVHPNLYPTLSLCPAGPGPALEGETQALDFKALSEGAWFAVEVKDKPRNKSARKCVLGEAAQSSGGGEVGRGEVGWACSAPLPAGALSAVQATLDTLLQGNLRGSLDPADPTPTQPPSESELHLFWPDLLHPHSTETCAQSWTDTCLDPGATWWRKHSQVGVEQSPGGPRCPGQALPFRRHGAACSTHCPPGFQASVLPQCATMPCAAVAMSIAQAPSMFFCYRGAPQEHVSGVKACEFHPTPEQGTAGRVGDHSSVNCPHTHRNLTCLATAGGMPGADKDSGLGGATTRNRAAPQVSVGREWGPTMG